MKHNSFRSHYKPHMPTEQQQEVNFDQSLKNIIQNRFVLKALSSVKILTSITCLQAAKSAKRLLYKTANEKHELGCRVGSCP